jgi:rhodanese-related sulfurtransferase
MGPFVPDIIGNELNYVVALVLGFGFGFVLEQAGFSSTKKLVGVFYGYDFVVLRVFFTAAVTAALGIIIFAHYGLLDIDLIYINPTFLWSAIVGGVIMGVGFILGGYCPGTGVCAAAVGRIDGMIFMAGAFLGVYLFAEGYPLFEGLYKGWNYGSPKVFDSLSMSQGAFAVLLTVVAVGAFWVTAWIEKKVNKGVVTDKTPVNRYIIVSGLAILLAVMTLWMPDRKTTLLNKAEDKAFLNGQHVPEMTSDELAFRLLDEDQKLQLIDVRDEKTFGAMALPYAVNIQLKNLFGKEWNDLLSDAGKKKVFYADDEESAKKSAVIAQQLGFSNVYVLAGGLNDFKQKILAFSKPAVISGRQEADTYRFREKASVLLPELIKKARNTAAVHKAVKKIAGGC